MTCGMATEFFDRFAYDRIIQDPGIVEYSRCAARRKATRMAVRLWRSSLIPDSASSSQLHKLKPCYSARRAVLRGGLKNGSGTTLAETVLRAASTVSSMLNVLPSVALSRLMEASAIMRFNVGDQVVDVALPTWRPAR